LAAKTIIEIKKKTEWPLFGRLGQRFGGGGPLSGDLEGRGTDLGRERGAWRRWHVGVPWRAALLVWDYFGALIKSRCMDQGGFRVNG
jgi:hypothetical protein